MKKFYKFTADSKFGKIMKRVLEDKKVIMESMSKGEDLSRLNDKGIRFAKLL